MLESSRTRDQLMIAARQKVKEREYWLKQLSGEPGKATIYTDKKRTGDTVSRDAAAFQLRGEVFERLIRLSGGADKPLHVILLTVLFLLMERYTGRQDIIIGTTIYRQDRDSRLPFTNTILPIRNRLDGAGTFKDLLLQTRQTVLEAVEHQSYPMEVLVKELNLSPAETHFSLFDAALLLENIQDKDYLNGIKIGFLFSFLRTGSGIEGKLEYDVLLYEREVVQRITAHFSRLLQSALESPGNPVAGLEMLPDLEKKQLLRDFNDTHTDYPGDKTIGQLFAEQVKNTPDNTALVFADKKLTYKALNEKANQLARVLRRKGVKADTIVGLMMERSIGMITAIFGILKAGGAYLPIDPGMPEKRILSMMNDCGVSILLTQTAVIHRHSFTLLQGLQTIRSEPLFTASRPQILDIDRLPIPDRSLVNYEAYIQYIGQAPVKNVITLIGTRGCPYHCAYCHKIWPKKHVPRSAENMFEEIKLFYDMGVRRFAFLDDVFNLDIKNSTKFFEMVIKKELKVQFFFPSGIRGDILSGEYIDLMVEAGLTAIPLALETASPRLQKLMGKRLNIEKFRKSVEYFCEKHPGVILELYVMIGFPTETKEEVLMTLDFIKSVKWFHFPYIFLLKIWENTDMAKLALANGVSRQDILNSDILAYQELPDTLPFEKSFVIKQQADFLGKYFLSKERLRHVLPFQMKVMTEDEIVKKYDSYLPVDIRCFEDLLRFTGIKREKLQVDGFVEEESMSITGLNEKLRRHFPRQKVDKDALRVLLLDLTRFFSYEKDVIYNVLEAPLGLMYLLTTLNREYGSRVKGKIAKSSVDFDNYKELKILIADFKPDVIGIRAMNHYKNFFHQTAALIRQWGFSGILITGGPYATSNTAAVLQDKNIDLVVIGEGEVTFIDLVGQILENQGKLPDEETLRQVAGIAFVPGRRESRVKFAREILLFDELEDSLAAESPHNPEPVNQSVNLAYTIFTSGSTGKPKGTLTTHGNVIRVVKDTNYIDIAADDRVLQLSNYAFDGSVFDIYGALLNGSSLVILKEDEVFSLDRLAHVIKREGITVFFVTTALFNLLVDMELECFQHVRKVLFGGERISVDHAGQALAYMGRDRIIHVYGPTETTVYAAFYFINEIPGAAATIPIGAPIANTTLYILDRYLQPLPVGVPGEICIGGSGTARGYMNGQELTAEKFVSVSYRTYSSSKIYKTGDLARWLPDGSIVFLGRLDYQVKIRGFRVEPGEIENHLLNHKDIKKAAVVVRERENQEKYLCAYVVARKEISSSQLREFLSRDLSEYMIPDHFIRLETIPLTVNGKVDRKALPVPETERAGTYMPPGNEVERKVVEIWSEVLRIEANAISIKADFFELGGHSLKAAALSAHLHKKLGVNVPLGKIFQNPTVQELAAFINKAEKEKYAAIEPVEKKEYCPMSSAQKRLYLIQELDIKSIAYNMPHILRLAEDIQIHRLEQAFKQIISRHESLRTSFHMLSEEPVQKIHDNVEFQIDYYDLAAEESHHSSFIIHHFIRPFDLSKAPLLRVGYTYTGTPDNQTLLLIDMHHIITDGTSQEILEKEFKALYQGEELQPLKLQYKDFAEWQNSSKQQELIKQQEQYWLDLFPGEIPVLNLPTDYKRPLIQSFEGAAVKFSLTPEISGALKQVAGSTDTTSFMVILALFDILLARLSSQEDIIVGAPVAARRHADLERIIGMFVNTLAFRNYPRGEKTFKIFLHELKTKTLAAYENQEYPFEDLVETVSVSRDMGRNPIFDVTFNFLDRSEYKYAAEPSKAGEKGEAVYRRRDAAAKFDINLTAVDHGEIIYCELEYCTRLFRAPTIERFIGYFKRIAGAAVKNINVKISEIDMMDKSEKALLLDAFNRTFSAYPCEKSICQLFEEQAARMPDSVSLIHGDRQITFDELNRRVNQLARYLIHQGVKRGGGSIAAIQGERSIELIIGIFAILGAGGAYLPIDPDYPQERIEYMLKDSGAGILLAAPADQVKEMGESIEIIDISKGLSSSTSTLASTLSKVGPANLAYIIYTSGSTGRPKGVMTTHYNVTRVVRNTNYIDIKPEDRILQLSNYAFDGSVFDIYGALLNRASLVIIQRDDVLAVDRLAEVIKRESITVFFVTTALFNTLVDLNIGCFNAVRKILFGGERVSVEHCRGALEYLGKDRIIHVYGPTETTVYASYYFINHIEENAGTIPIGKPVSNTTVYILDNYLKPVPIGVHGELFIGGYGVARGYLNGPELTAEKFISAPASSCKPQREDAREDTRILSPTRPLSHLPYSTIYKTGDLVRWLGDGNIEFLGRIDHQVKIRGFRIELGEIENRLLEIGGIDEVVTAAREDSTGQKYLCAYIVSRSDVNPQEIKAGLSRTLPSYMIPSHVIKLDRIPLTPNRKIDRKALPVPEFKAGESYIAPRNEVEMKMVELWSEILGIEKDAIGIDANFFELGGHSLKATELRSHLHKQLGVKIPLVEIFKNPSVRKLAAFINKAEKEKYAAIEPMEKKEYYPMSSAQKRVYVLQELVPGNTAYNIPYVLSAENIHIPLLEHAFKQLISRHESLRASFHMLGEEPVQRIHDGVEFQVDYYDLAAEESFHSSSIIHHFVPRLIRPFDLAKAPLLRVGLIMLPGRGAAPPILIVDMHHIISDGTSMTTFVKDFTAFYEGKNLQPLNIQYKDYTQWQHHAKNRESFKRQEAFWLKAFEDGISVLNLPLDYPRPAAQSFEGDRLDFYLTSEETTQLKELALAEDLTVYMMLLAIFDILLSRLSGQEDIIVGTPVAGRNHPDLKPIIGMFVNTLVIRNYPRGEKTFKQFLAEIRKQTLEAFENQDYPFEELVEKVPVARDTGRNPLFDVMLVLQNFEMGAHKQGVSHREKPGPGLKIKPVEYESGSSKFDLVLSAFETGEAFLLCFEYCTKLFNTKTIERFARYFKHIVPVVLADPGISISAIDIVPGEEKQTLLFAFNNTRCDYPGDKTISRLFADQVSQRPDSIAVIDLRPGAPPHYLTYRELSREVNRLAHLLKEEGVRPDTVAALLVPRPIRLITGILAVITAGGGYMPIDPDYPRERINYMLKDSGAKILLSEGSELSKVSGEIEVIDFSSLIAADENVDPGHLTYPILPTHLCYVLYTSGSTGGPKGVMVSNRNVVRLVKNTNYMEFSGNTRLLQNGSPVFDALTFELWGTLLNGGQLVLADKKFILDAGKLGDALKRYRINAMLLTPVFFNQLVRQDSGIFAGLEWLLVGGDVLSPTHINRARQSSSGLKVVNAYGPTENGVISTSYLINRDFGVSIPIGRPINNSFAYILGPGYRLQPVGVVGELYVGGDGVARGYMNNPELTAEKFVRLGNREVTKEHAENNEKLLRGVQGGGFLEKSPPGRRRQKLYKTGDLARWLADGNIEFLSRGDFQVKIRGHRIELGEIESHLLETDQIKEAVVVALASTDGEEGNRGCDKRLCAYFTAGRPLDPAQLRKYLSVRLPDYMVPVHFVQIEKIPVTPTGKVDRKMLPAPGGVYGLVREEYEPPTNEMEKRLVEIWQQVLKLEKIGIHDDFFEIGGDSLKAVQLVSQMIKDFDVSVSDIFAYRTAAALMKNVVMKKDNMKRKIEEFRKRLVFPGNKAAANPVQEKIMKALDAYRRQVDQAPLKGLNARNKYRKILLTGATGFLGAHLAAELLKITRAELYLLVRGKSKEDCAHRLERKLTHYFGHDFYHAHRERLQVVPGDLTGDLAGIDNVRYKSLSETIDAVIHAAANVKHFGHYADFYQTNVRGTEKLLQFSMTGKQKDFHYISTLSVCSGDVEGNEYMVYTEFSEDMGQLHENAYVESKFETEKKIYAARKQGLNASIYRLGNLVFHSQTGIFQENIEDNAFYANIKVFITLGAVADNLKLSDFTFVDQAARAIALLMMRKNLLNRNHHIVNRHAFEWKDMEQALENAGIKIQFLRPTLFFDYLMEQLEERSQRRHIERLLLHLGLFEKERKNRTVNSVAAYRTLKLLKKLDFQWPEITGGHIEKMIAHCQTVGFLEQ